MTRQNAFRALLCALVLTACDKNAVQDISVPATGARIKFFNFGVNAPAVNFYANDTKVTAISSATGVENTNGVAYGSAGAGAFYSSLPPGQYALTGRISATVDKDLVVSTVSATLEDGKHYSMYMSGFYNTTAKSVEGFIVEDNFPAAYDFAKAYVRFVNGISNSNPMTLFAKNTATTTESPVGALIAYKGGGEFVALEPGSYDLSARVAGASTNAISRTGVAFAAGRTYSISARGDITVTSATATNRPFLDNTANR